MRVRTPALVAAAIALLAPVSARADHGCNGIVTQLDTPAGTVYVDDRDVMTEAIWIYLESNGQPGLQSGGSNGIYDDGCSHEAPDMLIF